MSARHVLPRLRVEVRAAPNPHLLRAAIESRLAGRTFSPGPEDAVGAAVAKAVATQPAQPPPEAEEAPPWR